MKKKYYYMWIASIILFVVALIRFASYLLETSEINFIVCLIIIAVACVLYVISNRNLKLDGGYTAVQALFFFAVCRSEKSEENKKTLPKTDILRKTADRYDFSKNLSDEEVNKLYTTGKEIAESLKSRK